LPQIIRLLLPLCHENLIELQHGPNPAFGFYFLRLSSEWLFDTIARLERELAESRAEVARLSQAAEYRQQVERAAVFR
jgi:hypothetical protein